MAKRKTTIDKAIDRVDQQIAEHEGHIKALRLAREHLVVQQQEQQRGHTEGGRSI